MLRQRSAVWGLVRRAEKEGMKCGFAREEFPVFGVGRGKENLVKWKVFILLSVVSVSIATVILCVNILGECFFFLDLSHNG